MSYKQNEDEGFMKRRVVSLSLIMVMLLTACGKEKSDVDGEVAGEATASLQVSEESKTSEATTEEATQEVIKQTAETQTGSEAPEAGQASLSEEQLAQEWEELLSNLAFPTHKEEYVDSITEVLVSLPDEKPKSTLKQKDVDCDTLQWFNATYAMFVYSQGNDYHYIGGFNDESNSRKDYLKDQLEKSWGIIDRKTAIETLSWLATEGHATGYAEAVQMMDMGGMLSCSEEALAEYFSMAVEQQQISTEDAEYVKEYYLHLRNVNDICQDNGIDGWDYCRMMQISGNSYFAGFITLEECLSIQLAVAQAIQSQFDSWQELNDSYYYGYSYWAYGSYMVSFRKDAYDRLAAEEDSPWKVLDFNMPLEKFWQDNL